MIRKDDMRYDYSKTVEFFLDWYELNARILPWRSDPKPYYVWVSEIMLQQTRVEAVKGYFERFIEALPDVQALAEADDELLLKLWEGLGYYSRVRNMKKAAVRIMEEHGGQIPADYEILCKLPGIGAYTAGAIASIAYGLPEAAVDGNVLRVMKRIAGSFDDISKESVKKDLREDMKAVMPKGRCGEFTQSIMELGALVCIPNGKPLCEQCPVMHLCRAFHEDTIEKIPVKPAAKQRRIEERTVYVMECDGKFALHKREEKGLLAGLWELPNAEGGKAAEEMAETIPVLAIEELGKAKHVFSHVEWHMTGYYLKLAEFLGEYEWKSAEEISREFAIPAAFSAYTKHMFLGSDTEEKKQGD